MAALFRWRHNPKIGLMLGQLAVVLNATSATSRARIKSRAETFAHCFLIRQLESMDDKLGEERYKLNGSLTSSAVQSVS